MSRGLSIGWSSSARTALFLTMSLCLGTLSARGEIITLDFNALADGASNSTVRNYINGVLAARGFGGTVTLSGARGERNYTGDNHCVGPVIGSTVKALTLGNTDGGVEHGGGLDTFLTNPDSDRITMTFSKAIYQISFDYQIFPNADVPDGTNVDPSLYPDFTFKADNVQIFRSLAVMPGTFGTYPHSPFSGPIKNEKAPQLLTQSAMYAFPGGVKKLEFIDWPVLIGIDNLKFNTVPEPSSLTMLGLAVAGALLIGRRRRLRRSR